MAAAEIAAVRARRLFFPGMHLVMVVMAFVGFGPIYYLRTPELAPLTAFVAFHAAVMTVWMLLALVQSSLPAVGQTRLHRKLGWAGVVVAVAVLVTGVIAALSAAKGGRFAPETGLPSALAFAVIPLRSAATFAPLLILGVLKRKSDLESHRRLMLLATVTLMSAALGRMVLPGIPQPIPLFVGIVGLIGALIVYDVRKRGRPHPVSVWGGLAIIVSIVLTIPVGKSAAWLAFMEAIT